MSLFSNKFTIPLSKWVAEVGSFVNRGHFERRDWSDPFSFLLENEFGYIINCIAEAIKDPDKNQGTFFLDAV